MEILLTGGLGFIGSHIAIELLNMNYTVIIIDNLLNSKLSVLINIKKITDKEIIFYKRDLQEDINDIFTKHSIYAVIHLAGLKSVNESVRNPLLYYKENIMSTINLLETMEKFNCKNLIFSSSATVYGDKKSPLNENMEIGCNISNPYGKTKFMIEEILSDFCNINLQFSITSLRYFNPIGAHPSGLIGEDPNGIPNNLMPYILKVAYKNNINSKMGSYDYLSIYGNDYNTEDGTGVRDYIHVVDLARAHVISLKNIEYPKGYDAYNIGTGIGYSVLDVVNTFIKVNNVKLPYKFLGRRNGDIDIVYCETNKSRDKLKFTPQYNLQEMCEHAWNYQLNQKI